MRGRRFSGEWLEAHRVELESSTTARVIGIGHALAEVRSVLARLREPERAARLHAVPPTGLLFHGAPGTGKTLMARYLATMLGSDVPLYEVGSDELSPERIRGAITALARDQRGRSVLFIEEADAWASTAPFGTRSDTLVAALGALDGLVPHAGPVVVVATIRSPAELDEALVRSGRLGIHIGFDLPTEDERVELFELYLADRPLAGPLDLRRAARLTRGRTPADIRAYCDDAAALALARGVAAGAEELDDVVTDADLLASVRRAGDVEGDPGDEDRAARWRHAVHEAGHVAVAVVVREAAWVYSVRIDPFGGSTSCGREGASTQDVPDDEQRASVVVAFAGLAAERALLGEPALASGSDVAHATEIVLERITSGVEGATPISLASLGRNAPEAVKIVVGGRALESLHDAFLEAGRIVGANRDAIRRFAEILDLAGDLSGDELRRAIDTARFAVPQPTQ